MSISSNRIQAQKQAEERLSKLSAHIYPNSEKQYSYIPEIDASVSFRRVSLSNGEFLDLYDTSWM